MIFTVYALHSPSFNKIYYDIKKENRRVVFCGTVVPVNIHRAMDNKFYLWKIIRNWTADDLISVDTERDIRHLQKLYTELKDKPHALFNYIKKTVVDKLGIQGLDKMPELDRSIDVMIYQGFSDGLSNKDSYSNRIHSLVIGPPGIGKKFLRDIASIVNPLSGKATTVGRKLSLAGLIANEEKYHGHAVSRPGLLPLNSGGVVSFEDFHQLGGSMRAILAGLSETMEDGRATVSNVSKMKHEAVTAIHIDLNRRSDVEVGKFSSFANVGIAYNMISRFDYIVELPGDLDQLVHSVRQIFGDRIILSSQPQKAEAVDWKRDIKRLVAFQRTHWREVEIPPDVANYIGRRIEEAFELDNDEKRNIRSKVIRDHLQRVSRSVLRFVKAIACSNNALVITRDDVDRAFKYIGDKIEFLKTVNPDDVGDSTDPRHLRVKGRIATNLAKLPEEFRTGDYVALTISSEKDRPKKAAEMEALRDLARMKKEKLVKSSGHGKWEKIIETEPKKLPSKKAVKPGRRATKTGKGKRK